MRSMFQSPQYVFITNKVFFTCFDYKRKAIFRPEQKDTKKRGSFTTVIRLKAIPLQAWTGPEGSRRLRLPDFKTIGIYRS